MIKLQSKTSKALVESGWKIGYKLVTNGKSYNFGGREKSCVAYRPGQYTRPYGKYGPLCVFSSIKALMRFAGYLHQYEDIFVIVYKPSASKTAWCRVHGTTELCSMPSGTKFADVVFVDSSIKDKL